MAAQAFRDPEGQVRLATPALPRLPLGLLGLLGLAGCPHTAIPRPYPAPAAAELLAHLAGLPERAPSLNAETRTDVRLGNDRVNVTVYMLAVWGGRLRFQALDPNDSMAADLASDGRTYCLIDVHANCGECGPATPDRVARLVRIPLLPDQVVAVLLGAAPVITGQAEVMWDEGSGHEVVTVHGGGQTERLVLDGHGRNWDLLEADLTAEGKPVWTVRHKDFHDVTTKAGQVVRLPGASLFEQGGDTVRILWRDQKVGEDVPATKFQLSLQPGLQVCGERRSGL